MQLNNIDVLFDDNPSPMWIYEVSSLRILKVNKAAVDRYGYSEQEFLSMTIRNVHPAADHEKFNAFIDKFFSGSKYIGIAHSGVWKHQTKSGEVIYAEINSHAIKFENHNSRVVVVTDATEKVRAQEEVIWIKNSLEALINNTEDPIWSVDKQTRYVYMNRPYRNHIAYFTGVEPREGDYTYLHHSYGQDVIEQWKHYYNRALAGEQYIIISQNADPLTGQVQSFEVSFNPIYNKTENDITGVGCFARNITERLNAEKAIIDQNERLRYIASLTSHELRRPVASMLGLINIMDRVNFFNPDNEEIIGHLLTVGNEIDEVIRLIVDKAFTGQLPGPGANPQPNTPIG